MRQKLRRRLEELEKISAAAAQLASKTLGEVAQRIERAAAEGDFSAITKDLENLKYEIRSLEALTT